MANKNTTGSSGSYYGYPTQGQQGQGYYPYQGYGYPQQAQQTQQQQPYQNQPQATLGVTDAPGQLPIQQSYIENILRLNKGKEATVYMTFEASEEWNSKIFKGIIEAAGRDHIILSDPNTGKRYLLLTIYLDYITFDEEINYNYPYGQQSQSGNMSTYSPR
ncbi:spore coat protein GerQ [Aureibacillus halotolerans]|uniref:Spore germination protein Q n=1 Tax=Aureibacillus halotolerans TaxID=1508390 RepID=A0A4R6TXZ5_9BACI|nr:spore coat protein GerQ [Aureibacillus halotolerans]TDQ38780.1 spore germination protein Q [Aureibacillus halotolerans]